MNLVTPLRRVLPRRVLDSVVAPFHYFVAFWFRPRNGAFTYQGKQAYQIAEWDGATERDVGALETLLGIVPVFGYFGLAYVGATYDSAALEFTSLVLVLVALVSLDVTVELVGDSP